MTESAASPTRSAPSSCGEAATRTLRIATANINGIRAAHRRGFAEWLAHRQCDVIALQEVRCPVEALPEDAFGDYCAVYDPGDRAGRNGVALLTRVPPAEVRTWQEATYLARPLRAFAAHGRYIEADLADHPITVASLYLPKGGLPEHLQRPDRMREAPDGGAKYRRKMSFLEGFARQVERSRREARRRGRDYLLLGDLNIAHTELDVAMWRRNLQAEGFLPEERAWLGSITGPRRLIDVVRRLHPDVDGPYSWWSWLGTTFERDAGWRIDYHLATPPLARRAVRAMVDRLSPTGQRLSDHAPVVVDYLVH